ncbi:hypothetical protein [Paraburkholderia caribensis]|uniref:hypothetical protein n=1 Tax=Paraburkholderia caribensis TaxID=75105 RepID=UPI0034D390F3
MQGKSFFLERAISRALDWLGHYPALGCASHDPQSISGGRQVVAVSLTDDGVRCVFFSAVGSVLDFTATWAELERAKTWWYFVQRWYFWVVPDRQTLEKINVTTSTLDHLIVPSYAEHTADATYLKWLGNIEARARQCGTLAASRLELETA